MVATAPQQGHGSHRNKKGGHEAHLGFILLSI